MSSPLPHAISVSVHTPPRSPVRQEQAQAEAGTAAKDTRGSAATGAAPAQGARTSAHVRASTTETGVLGNTRGRGAAAPSRLPRAAPPPVGAGVADGGGSGAAGVQARARRGGSAGNHLRGQTRVREGAGAGAGVKAGGRRSLGDGAVGFVGGGPSGVGENGIAAQKAVMRAAAEGAGTQGRARAHEETGEGLTAMRRRVKTRARTVSTRA